MTNINCSANCIHQKDGKCNLSNTEMQSFNNISNCAYFKKGTQKANN